MKTRLALKINAGAKRTQFAGRHGDAWKLRVAAPPVDGKANAAILKFIAQIAGVRASEITIISGQTSSAAQLAAPVPTPASSRLAGAKPGAAETAASNTARQAA